ncbi:NAD-dependent epimerase/dehydratase family protein [uncultured Shewanella sp.]|uniref:NAD-dependent epimerase/dehydratase family protein n=1 Tax=uncultured Shewanella sp. TaxID=173975 RepID=UPI00260827D6|nr:NAD-dependent epimerase/dehydratase family protein [uncultured Shewanella sp.]
MSKIIITASDSILVTGSNGFVGSYLNKLLAYRCAIATRTFNRQSLNHRQVLLSSLVQPETPLLFNEAKVVIHLAGIAHSNQYEVSEFQRVNHRMTLNLGTQAAKAGVRRFVFVSSIGVNGTSTSELPFSNASDVNPHNAYAQSKYDAELGLKKIAEETGLEVVIVRPTLVYGRNAPGNFGLLINLVQKLPFLPFGLADNKRDFISVQNLADLLITCANNPNAAGHTFLASDGETVSIKDFTNAIAKGLNKKLIQLPVPFSLMYLAARIVGKQAMAEQLLGNLQVDSSNAQEVLGWVPPFTMEQAMASLTENKK